MVRGCPSRSAYLCSSRAVTPVVALAVVGGHAVCGTVRAIEVQVTGDGEREDYVGIGVFTIVLSLEREEGREGGALRVKSGEFFVENHPQLRFVGYTTALPVKC